MSRKKRRGIASVLVFLVFSGCGQNQKRSGLTAYDVPVSFLPDAGSIDLMQQNRHIQQLEFGFSLTQEALAKQVAGYQTDLHGVSQDTTVIVNVFDPTMQDNRKLLPVVAKNWDDHWAMTGNYAFACMWDEPDNMTGYYRYHMLCDPAPNPNSPFLLMDRIPNPSKPRPSNQNYIKGTCILQGNLVRPDDVAYHQCLFSRRTTWGDKFSFRLRSENVRLLNEVEYFISGLLQSWRVDPGPETTTNKKQ